MHSNLKLPIWRTVGESFKFCFLQFGEFLKIAFVPYILLCAAKILSMQIPSMIHSGEPIELAETLSDLYLASFIVVSVIFATSWHRAYLLNDSIKNSGLLFCVGRREFNYAWRGTCGLFLALLAGGLVFSIVALVLFLFAPELVEGDADLLWVAFPPAIIAFSIVFLRLELIYPTAAVGRPIGFVESWKATKDSLFRIFSIYTLITIGLLPFSMVNEETFKTILVYSQVWGLLDNSEFSFIEWFKIYLHVKESWLFQSLFIGFEIFVTAVGITALSIIYKFLSVEYEAKAVYVE